MNTEFILRIFVAAILGGAIGLEREYRAKEAGFRTHFLVGLGSALFMVLSEYGVGEVLSEYAKTSFDPSRIASQVVTGIGFIGAGTIIFQKHVVRGLTTAAGLWVTSAIGLTCGAGMYVLAIAATTLVLLCLEAMNFILRRFGTREIEVTFTSTTQDTIQTVLSKLGDANVEIDSYNMKPQDEGDDKIYTVTLEMKIRRKDYQDHILSFMREFRGVSVESIE
ncbi:MgtC/SapB family protein [Prevotella sp. AGR2160]|uniref:MgtC/SapB family protein n=1 Tax=Prevotella sp. AGR2160 TaxID=1280674 RepID=UPI0004109A4B|nr:MgtC/SapB family protein [Prevotella sp. AGR2160]